MYRDIKPDNIGFDVKGTVKLFDFGLVREFDRNNQCEGGLYYNYTAFVGTPRYMDPQVALGRPYNELCDVYSFSVLFWEMLQLQIPFAGYTSTTRTERVVYGGERPPIKESWPPAIKNLVRSGFGEMTNRISMANVCQIIGNEVENLSSTANKSLQIFSQTLNLG
jgi:serine/threonine protein kinase